MAVNTSPKTSTPPEHQLGRLVVIPSESLNEYIEKGIGGRLEAYYNPAGVFREVYAISRHEKGTRTRFGMTVIGVKNGKEFQRHLARIRPDVVRAYGGYGAADFACRYRVNNIPVVISLHDTNPDMLYPAVRRADEVWCMSRVVRDLAIDFGISSDRLKMLPNRVDTTLFQETSATPSPEVLTLPAGRYLLHVGRATRQKNLDTLIHSLQLLPNTYHIISVGKGHFEPYIKLAQELGLSDRFKHVGAIPNEKLGHWYGWCDAMVTPSRWEGFGVVFIEAAASGAPIITSDIQPMNEYLEHGVSAHLVSQFEDPSELAKAILSVCENSEYRAKLSEGARRAVIPFDAKIIDEQEADYYRQIKTLPPRGFGDQCGDMIWRLKTSHRIRKALLKPRRTVNRLLIFA